MSARQSDKSKALYDDYARKVGADDLHRQVWRTINGEPISQEQIELIVTSINAGLDLRADSYLLELACGNGALSQYFLNRCKEYVGVDISECLVDVAKKRFEIMPSIRFVHDDVYDFLSREEKPEKFTRILCYAAFQYFPDSMIVEVLKTMYTRFVNVERIFIGNHPDLDLADQFFGAEVPDHGTLTSNETPIGIWRSKADMRKLCTVAGWHTTFSRMPDEFYASAYRFNAVLKRGEDHLQ